MHTYQELRIPDICHFLSSHFMIRRSEESLFLICLHAVCLNSVFLGLMYCIKFNLDLKLNIVIIITAHRVSSISIRRREKRKLRLLTETNTPPSTKTTEYIYHQVLTSCGPKIIQSPLNCRGDQAQNLQFLQCF